MRSYFLFALLFQPYPPHYAKTTFIPPPFANYQKPLILKGFKTWITSKTLSTWSLKHHQKHAYN